MAFSVRNGGSGIGKSRFRGGTGTLSEINIVPLVDVVLVLLIIFMLTAHVMEYGLEVDVPKVKAAQDTAEDLPVVTLSRTGETFLADKAVNINLMGDEIRKRYPNAKGAFVRADKETTWDPIA